jgi:hypothetical protein
MQRWSEEHREFAVETFFKNNDSTSILYFGYFPGVRMSIQDSEHGENLKSRMIQLL